VLEHFHYLSETPHAHVMLILSPSIIFIVENESVRHVPSSSEEWVLENIILELWHWENISPNPRSLNIKEFI
jgi:hypothetical protein